MYYGISVNDEQVNLETKNDQGIHMNTNDICACGLNCSDCMFAKKDIYETARKLKDLIDESKLNIFLSIMSRNEVNTSIAQHLNTDQEKFSSYFQMFQKMPDFLEVLDGLINIECKYTCQESGGCSMCGTTKECITIKCVKEKKLDGCWECPEHKNCSKLTFQRMSYGKTIDENLKIIAEQGKEAVPSRDGNYYEWQRKLYPSS